MWWRAAARVDVSLLGIDAEPLREALSCGVHSQDCVGAMSKLLCTCGNTIRDNTSSLPYKAAFLKDMHCEPFSDWFVGEVQSYVAAVERGEAHSWLLSRGYSEDYIALGLDHGNVLYDHIHARFIELRRTAYECSACGRVHLETVEDNMFVAYTPDSPGNSGVFSKKSDERAS